MVGRTARRPLRADARRNYERIVSAAQEAFLEQGADASLEEIARRAGVGSATLHRHFPSRHSLLQAVFRDRVDALCARARERAAADEEPGAALFAWLHDFNAYAAASHGLVASLLRDGQDAGPPRQDDDCAAMITAAADELLRRAQRTGAVRADIRTSDLLTLLSALSLAVLDDDGTQTDRMLDITINGLRPHA